jgi:hypothetical protein
MAQFYDFTKKIQIVLIILLSFLSTSVLQVQQVTEDVYRKVMGLLYPTFTG